jgi:hypothetical protein
MSIEQAKRARAQEEQAEDDIEERAQMLTEAAGDFQLAGQSADAERCYRKAIADGGWVVGDVRSYYSAYLDEIGEPERAAAMRAELWASNSDDPFAYRVVAENLEADGDVAGALRWLDGGLSRLYGDGVVTVNDVANHEPLNVLLGERSRVREAAGMPQDELDQAFAQYMELSRPLDSEPEEPAPEMPAIAVPYWPEAEFEAALLRWPGAFPAVVRQAGTHVTHRQLVEQTLRLKHPLRPGAVVRLSAEKYDRYVGLFGADPEAAGTPHQYACLFGALDGALTWPPTQDELCWCGSGGRYGMCCGAPGFAV